MFAFFNPIHLSFQPWQIITNLFSISKILSFQKCYIDRITQHITFWDRLAFFTQHNSLKMIEIVICIIVPLFLLLTSLLGYIFIRVHLTHSLVEESGCFQFLLIMNRAAVNICIQVLLWVTLSLYDKNSA